MEQCIKTFQALHKELVDAGKSDLTAEQFYEEVRGKLNERCRALLEGFVSIYHGKLAENMLQRCAILQSGPGKKKKGGNPLDDTIIG